MAFAGVLLAGGVAVAALGAKGPPPRQVRYEVKNYAQVAPQELAQWIIEGRRDFVVVDMRQASSFDAAHVRGAVSCGTCHENKEQGRKFLRESSFVDLSKKLVLYTETGKEPITLPKLLATNPRLYVLTGGWQAWKDEVLAPVTFGGEADESALAQKKKREAIRAFFSGERPTNAPADLPLSPIKRDNAHTPAAAREGC